MVARIVLIGMGNVGKSFLKLIKEKIEMLKKSFNLEIKVLAIFEYDGVLINESGLDINEILKKDKKFRELTYWKSNVKALDYLSTLKCDICVETTPTNPNTGEPAVSHIFEALKNNMDVISSNKGPFYLKYDEIKKFAKEKSRYVKYEATVASCVPALSSKMNLLGNEILSIQAILNGTCNYILSRMSSEHISFSMALQEAQELGYAETDPTLDIEGYDAAGKLVILANEYFGWSKTIKDVNIKGITKITPQAIELAESDGYMIKHLAIVENNKLIVEPRLIERDSPLNIGGTLNVIEFQTKYAGPMIFMGRGAGGFEAASAILNDLINIAERRNFFN